VIFGQIHDVLNTSAPFSYSELFNTVVEAQLSSDSVYLPLAHLSSEYWPINSINNPLFNVEFFQDLTSTFSSHSLNLLSTPNTSPNTPVQEDELLFGEHNMPYMEYAEYRLNMELERRQKLNPHLTKDEIYDLMMGLGLDSVAFEMSSDNDLPEIDYSNMIEWKGKNVDVSKLNDKDLMKLVWETDDYEKLMSLEHIRSIYFSVVPETKLFYPEPYIASATFIHTDIGYVHIFQYQYWLWFVFIFLIIFFFITFLCTVRWCSMRNQPRRETRGVSRSKCGDLITACVPVSWAASIIVSESTDATDVYDGFGTSEIMVGIRAYQWGWEYYYPKNIDLQYNVRPSYSSFIGNSLKYNASSEKKLNTNDVWKYYQNRSHDAVVTPAHLLVLPVDNNKMFNFLNFKNIGVDTAKESNAFKKVRMFSKAYTTNLVSVPSDFSDKYVKLNSLYANENDFNDSLNYGLKRQHNLTSTAATSNNSNAFLDKRSMDKFLNHNFQQNTKLGSTSTFSGHLHDVKKDSSSTLNLSSTNTMNVLNSLNSSTNSKEFNQLTTHPNLIQEFNDNSDKSVTRRPVTKLLNETLSSKNLLNNPTLANSLQVETSTSTTGSTVNLTQDNTSSTVKEKATFSDNQSVLMGDRSVRKYGNLNPNDANYNLSNGLNSLASNLNSSDSLNAGATLNSVYNGSRSKWLDQTVFTKLASNRLYMDGTVFPVMMTNPYTKSVDFDSTTSQSFNFSSQNKAVTMEVNSKKGDIVKILLGADSESTPSSAFSAYWNMFWRNSNPNLRIDNAVNSSLAGDIFYLPLFTNYAEYDFRNEQSLELLEESFWESSYSSYSHFDYLDMADSFKKSRYVTPKHIRYDLYFYPENTEEDLTTLPMTAPITKDLSLVGEFYANSVEFDDFISPSNLLNTDKFSLFPLSENSLMIDDSYTDSKQLLAMYNNNSSFFLNTSLQAPFPQSYIAVLNNFRADFDDFAWNVDLDSTKTDTTPSLADANPDQEAMSDTSEWSKSNAARISNPATLRNTAKNSMVTYSALKKVFRARFEDGRANTKMTTFGNFKVKQPFMNDVQVPYNKLLGKNKENFFNVSFFKTNTFMNFNDLAAYNNSLNYYFFDFPFLLAEKSDAAKSIWFDWYAQWGMYEVQPSNSSKYSTLGVPYLKKPLEYNNSAGGKLNKSETYFTRISRARKNYLPVWTYAPYLDTRTNTWVTNNKLSLLNYSADQSLDTTFNMLSNMNWYWSTLFFSDSTISRFNPSTSGNNLYAKSLWRPYASVQAYYYHVTNLIDILTKREYLYRQYFESTRKIANLPNQLTANPKNPLIAELKSSFLFIDPTTYNSEYSREVYYNSLSYFKFMVLKGWLLNLSQTSQNLPINLKVVNDYLFYYFFNPQKSNSIGKNQDLYKNQYRPLRKGITSMLRLHATGAVAMPTEVRLQILASSRDVIHSWAIPSAGIKIDCIPGYTSHRIMIFMTSGIYWGQCMEICGRFHHWMPIVVYFMKRDLFFLWCTHFMFENDIDAGLVSNDRQLADYIKFASYDKATWLSEVGKTL